MKIITLLVETAVAPVWALFGKFGLLLIPTCGHTELLSTATKNFSNLSVNFDTRLSAKLSSSQVGVVTRVDGVGAERLVHVLVDVEPVEQDGSVLVRHQVLREALLAELLCKRASH